MSLSAGVALRAGRTLPCITVPTCRTTTQRLFRHVDATFWQRRLSTAIYQTLNHANNEIRLLSITPGQKGDEIACRLEVVSLDLLPIYDTLSYTWGSPKKTSQILVDDDPVRVTASLYNALRSLRHPRKTVTLWADGLCIDQGNNAEKSKQVAIMDRIYAYGRQTWISLGSPDVDWANGTWSPPSVIDESFSTAKYVLRYIWSVWWHNIMWRRSHRSRLGAGHLNDARRQLKNLEGKSSLGPQQERDRRMAVSMLDWLMNNEYWRRVWILQEVVLSEKDSICIFGVHQIPLLSLDTVLGAWREGGGFGTGDNIPSHLRMGYARAMEVCLLRDETFAVRHFALIRCLYFSSHRNASQAIDHVHGIRGILSREDRELIPLDFNIPTSVLYANVTRILLRKTRSADVLCASAGADACTKHGLPSWALDISTPLQFPASVDQRGTAGFPLPEDSLDARVLYLEGGRLDEHIVSIKDQNVSLSDTLGNLESALSDAECALTALQKLSTEPETDGQQSTRHAAEMTAHAMQVSRHVIEIARIETQFYRRTNNTILQFLNAPPAAESMAVLQPFYDVIKARVYERYVQRNQPYIESDQFEGIDFMFYTSGGRIGKCLNRVEVGDSLWKLPGSQTVFVLRSSPSSDAHILKYRLVGPCVCSGAFTVTVGTSPTTQRIGIV
ncbi:uncharacterized protein N0V89_010528 [Didymosphaeria variabile]|uniref:Heterokaryon incompatibility domain-containing protein n=1 Tax=Didymosphaeria variabile TaxID=1932322 RepID=A0A9W9C780_9PLEO|nr:uncharacterized protein N0V89_010528 [Didymosphaeria variabile]KAJ4346597.1 hypothetical protein N0V89_010528 [Didymosphaeria variabile]